MITCDFRTFQTTLKSVATACSKDEKRPVLQCVYLTGARLYATDGFRLHFADLPQSLGLDVLLDAALVAGILKSKVARKDSPVLAFDLDAGHALIDGRELAGGFSHETYPDVSYIIPKGSTITVEVNPLDLLAAVKSARVFAHAGSNVGKLTITGGQVAVTGRSEETGESQNLVRLYKHEGADLVIGFNCDFLIDYLKRCNPNPVTIGFTRSTAPALFGDADGLQAVIMPMSLSDPRPESIPAESDKSAAGSYVYPTSLHYSQVREIVNGGRAPAWYIPTPARDEERGDPFPYAVRDDIWESVPEGDAVESEIQTVWALTTEPRFGKGTKIAVLHLVDTASPIPAEGTVFEPRQPLFASETESIGECTRCGDGPHWRTKINAERLCKACYVADIELRKQYH